MISNTRGGGEKADAVDLKSIGREAMWVRLPPALYFSTRQ